MQGGSAHGKNTSGLVSSDNMMMGKAYTYLKEDMP